ncbi:hypothetical protein FNF31_04071 [Cafeteria roenbergensis]|uniref:glutamate--tRNA ligase n=1 Tax=Cafeteria roenbergensis TaxID=33653 RepID=A0A5A8D8L2_CAFRO|nr:hypothetical protein FNF31_04071 [Cafeteria roenbergensis]KAA0164542.1 hypothetical protein FNF28_03781 [Cafeteria roenbergensis]
MASIVFGATPPLASLLVARVLGFEVAVKYGTPAVDALITAPSGATAAGDAAGAALLATGSSFEASAADMAQWGAVAAVVASRPAEATTAALDKALFGKTFLAGAGTRLTVCDVVLSAALFNAGVRLTAGAGARWQATCDAVLPWAAVQEAVTAVTPAPVKRAAAAAAAAASSGAGDKKAGKKAGKKGKGGGGGDPARAAAARKSRPAKIPKAGNLPGLEGHEAGIVTRFPPEPSGYLHIGHVKAIMVNNFYARHYGGKLLVRFDDTNPSKERDEFEGSILDDLVRLGVKPDMVSHTSDHFDLIADYAREMIRAGHAYMDCTPVEEMRRQRGEGIASEYKLPATSVEVNLERFEAMFAGTEDGVRWCLRANMDITDPNKCCRDPVLFRANATPHLRTGTRYKAYPTYDFACPIVDAIEGVTHAMRTTEYRDRDPQYHILQGMLGVRHVNIIEFSRLNFIFTTLSKRKLTWFADNGIVEGWNDPRFPTVQGVLRRGVQVQALQDFIMAQGASKKDVEMEWDKFWAMNKKVVDPIAHRFFGISDEGKVPVVIAGAPEEPEAFSVPLHPKNAEAGTKAMYKASRVFVEGEDAASFVKGEEVTLMRWGNIVIDEVVTGPSGAIEEVRATLNEAGDVKATKLKVCWIPDMPGTLVAELCEFDNLITKAKLEEDDKLEDFVNPVTKAVTRALCEPAARAVSPDQVIQLERRGYFRCDKAFVDDSRPLVLFNVPDGKTKAMSSLSTGLTSRAQAASRDRIVAATTATAAGKAARA